MSHLVQQMTHQLQ
uniref:Uncharacterized protein n=1 Tax=Solanum lycopersicum TaxID=4081 RepID=A0A3Q7G0G9_SOLLC